MDSSILEFRLVHLCKYGFQSEIKNINGKQCTGPDETDIRGLIKEKYSVIIQG